MSRKRKHPSSELSQEKSENSKFENIDYMAHLIDNPGLDHLGLKIFKYLDFKSLQKCKTVCKLWNQFIDSSKTLLLVQIFQLKTYPIKFKGKSQMNNYFEEMFSCQNFPEHRKKWEKIFQLLYKEDLDTLKNFYRKLKTVIEVNIKDELWNPMDMLPFPEEVCLQFNLFKTFENLFKECPNILQFDIIYFHFCVKRNYKQEINMKAVEILLKCLKIQGKDLTIFHLELYENWTLFSAPEHVELNLPIIELLLQKADVYGINFNARSRMTRILKGKTLFELATSNGHESVVQLLRKYNVVS